MEEYEKLKANYLRLRTRRIEVCDNINLILKLYAVFKDYEVNPVQLKIFEDDIKKQNIILKEVNREYNRARGKLNSCERYKQIQELGFNEGLQQISTGEYHSEPYDMDNFDALIFKAAKADGKLQAKETGRNE